MNSDGNNMRPSPPVVADVPTPEELAAMEIGRAFMSAQKAAAAIIADAHRRAAHPVPAASAATLDPTVASSLAAQVDEIEETLSRSQDRLLKALRDLDRTFSVQPAMARPPLVEYRQPSEAADDDIQDSPDGPPVEDTISSQAEAALPQWPAPDTTSDHSEEPVVPPAPVITWAPPDPTERELEPDQSPLPSARPDATAGPAAAAGDPTASEQPVSGNQPIKMSSKSWLVNLVATGVVIVVLVIALLLVNLI